MEQSPHLPSETITFQYNNITQHEVTFFPLYHREDTTHQSIFLLLLFLSDFSSLHPFPTIWFQDREHPSPMKGNSFPSDIALGTLDSQAKSIHTMEMSKIQKLVLIVMMVSCNYVKTDRRLLLSYQIEQYCYLQRKAEHDAMPWQLHCLSASCCRLHPNHGKRQADAQYH